MNVTILPVGMLGTNCYILQAPSGSCVVIDPGAQPEKIIAAIKDAGLTPRLILLTHGHHDHIGGVNRLRAAYPEAELYIGADDVEMLENTDKSYAAVRHQNADDYRILGAKPLRDGEELTLDTLTIRAVATPGHTRGGMTYLCGELMFSGDTLFYRECGRCDLYGGNFDEMLASLKRLAELAGDYTVYPGHGESSTLQAEREHNPYMKQALQ